MNWKDIGREVGRQAQEKAKKDLLPSVLRHAASFLTDTAMLLERPEVMKAGFSSEVSADVEESEGPGPAPKQGGDIVINTFGGSEDAGQAAAARTAMHVRRVRQQNADRFRETEYRR